MDNETADHVIDLINTLLNTPITLSFGNNKYSPENKNGEHDTIENEFLNVTPVVLIKTNSSDPTEVSHQKPNNIYIEHNIPEEESDDQPLLDNYKPENTTPNNSDEILPIGINNSNNQKYINEKKSLQSKKYTKKLILVDDAYKKIENNFLKNKTAKKNFPIHNEFVNSENSDNINNLDYNFIESYGGDSPKSEEYNLKDAIPINKVKDAIQTNKANAEYNLKDAIQTSKANAEYNLKDAIQMSKANAKYNPNDAIKISKANAKYNLKDAIQMSKTNAEYNLKDAIQMSKTNAEYNLKDVIQMSKTNAEYNPNDAIKISKANTEYDISKKRKNKIKTSNMTMENKEEKISKQNDVTVISTLIPNIVPNIESHVENYENIKDNNQLINKNDNHMVKILAKKNGECINELESTEQNKYQIIIDLINYLIIIIDFLNKLIYEIFNLVQDKVVTNMKNFTDDK